MMTLAAFKTAFPEFKAQTDDRMNAALTDAAAQTDAEVFAENEDRAHGLLAAHILASAPSGREARLSVGKDAFASFETVYLAERRRLENMCAAGGWVNP